tara:strand:- start:3584 stop:5668 length:2085 start_codon:yes stop_codon:yes gene_type:complete
MAFQVSPGVEVKEIDLTNIVPAVSTTNAGFAGFFDWGPLDQSIRVTSVDDLREKFGKPTTANKDYWFTAANYLTYASSLNIVRVVNEGTSNTETSPTLNAGESGGVLIKNLDDYNTKTTTTAADWNGNHFVAKFAGGDAPAGNTGAGIELGNSLLVSVSNRSGLTFSSTAGYAAGTTQFHVQHNTNFRIAAGSEYADNIKIGGSKYRVLTSAFNLASKGSTVSIDSPGLLTQSASITAGLVEWKYSNVVSTVTPATSEFAESKGATAGSKVNDIISVVVVDEDGYWSGTRGQVLEVFDDLSVATNAKRDDGATQYWKNVIRDTSEYIYTGHQFQSGDFAVAGSNLPDTSFNLGNTFGLLQTNQYLSLKGGKAAAPSGDDFYTNGYEKFADSETSDISLVLGGPSVGDKAKELVTLADNRKDAIAFLSPPKLAVLSSSDVPHKGYISSANIIAYRNGTDAASQGGNLTGTDTSNLNVSSSFAFLDSGYKYQYDRFNDVFRYVPLNGDIAGIAARADVTSETWFSPAGFNRGQLNNVVSLAYNPDKTSRDDLYKNGINPVISLPGQGTVLFGDKTLLKKPSAFDRINVRRLFIVLEKAISTAAKFQLFELNDRFTRAQFKNLIEPFLLDVQSRRGITDFRVVCDETNNTPEVIDRNSFVADIFVQPARSINFITLNFVATRTGVDFEELTNLGGGR